MRVGPTLSGVRFPPKVCPTITKRRPNILLARGKQELMSDVKTLPPRGCVVSVIDKIGNFVTIPVHAFGSESEHLTIYVTGFGGRVPIGVQSKRFFFFFFLLSLPGWGGQTIDPIFCVRFCSIGKTAASPGRGRWSSKTITSVTVSMDHGYHQSSFITGLIHSRILLSWRIYANAFLFYALVRSPIGRWQLYWTVERGILMPGAFWGAHRLRMHDSAGRCFSRYQATLLPRSYSTVNLDRCQCHVNTNHQAYWPPD